MFRVFVNWGMLIGSNRTNLKFNDEPNTINGFMDQVVGLFTYNGPQMPRGSCEHFGGYPR